LSRQLDILVFIFIFTASTVFNRRKLDILVVFDHESCSRLSLNSLLYNPKNPSIDMHLLRQRSDGDFSLTDNIDNIPSYTILSHTWETIVKKSPSKT
jgi:hypothetical protein